MARYVNDAEHCMLGNFPQAFSHAGVINTAINLASAGGLRFLALRLVLQHW